MRIEPTADAGVFAILGALSDVGSGWSLIESGGELFLVLVDGADSGAPLADR